MSNVDNHTSIFPSCKVFLEISKKIYDKSMTLNTRLDEITQCRKNNRESNCTTNEELLALATQRIDIMGLLIEANVHDSECKKYIFSN